MLFGRTSILNTDGRQCSRLKSLMLFKHDLALQNIPLSKQPFKTHSQIENEDVTWTPQYNMPATRTNKHRALSLQEAELDGWFVNSSHCTKIMYHMIHAQVLIWVLYFISIFLDWRFRFDQLFNWSTEIWEPFRMNLIRGLQSWSLMGDSGEIIDRWVSKDFSFLPRPLLLRYQNTQLT